MKRRRKVARRRSRRDRVRGGTVETVYSIVVGEGRRVWRWGAVVSILRRMVAGGGKFAAFATTLELYR
jgi:hypothetical protein